VKNFSLERNGLLVMLDLYYEYIQITVPFDDWKIVGLRNFVSVDMEFNEGLKPQQVLEGWSNGQMLNLEESLSGLDSAVPEEWRFTYFVKNVVDGHINVDSFPSFQNFMKDDFTKMLKAHTSCMQNQDTEPLPASSFALTYKPPPSLTDEEGLKKMKSDEREEGSKVYTDTVEKLFTFNGSNKFDAGLIGPTTVGGGTLLLKDLIKRGAVKKVIFDKQKLKELYLTKTFEPSQTGQRMLSAVDGILKETAEKKRKHEQGTADVATKTINKTAEKKQKHDNATPAAATKTPSGLGSLKSKGSPGSKGSPKKGKSKSGMSLDGDSETNDHDELSSHGSLSSE
jgi:hypothetical protein